MILQAEEFNTELWKWPNFILLAVLLVYMIRKQAAPLLNARSEEIKRGLEAGEKAQEEARQRAARVEAKIANLDREIASLKETAKADLERESLRIRREAEAEIARIERHTAVEIVSLGKQARLELHQYAAGLALDLAEQKIRARMSPDAQATLVGNFGNSLTKSAQAAGRVQ